MKRKKFQTAIGQRAYVIVYQDFLWSGLLDPYEKLVFIALKSFADKNSQCFPSINTLVKMTGLSEKKIRMTISGLVKKSVIDKESRTRPDGGKSSNLYTLYDYAEMWDVGNNDDDENTGSEEAKIKEQKLIAELKALGYTVTKEKELASESNSETSKTQKYNICNYTTESSGCQEQTYHGEKMGFSEYQEQVCHGETQEQYTLDVIKDHFDYEALVDGNTSMQEKIDNIINMMHTVMNTSRPTIRISGENMPKGMVISRMMKLDGSDLTYAIGKYEAQARQRKITNPVGYMLTLLYKIPEQKIFDTEALSNLKKILPEPLNDRDCNDILYAAGHDFGKIKSAIDRLPADCPAVDLKRHMIHAIREINKSTVAEKRVNIPDRRISGLERYNSFHQRTYDYDALERELLATNMITV